MVPVEALMIRRIWSRAAGWRRESLRDYAGRPAPGSTLRPG
jgi:hypothetical protein